MKNRVPMAIAAVLTACGAVATTSNDSADSAPQKNASAKMQPSSPDIARKMNASAGQTGSDDWSGTYDGSSDGGGLEAQIKSAGANAYRVELTVTNPETSCGGSISGVGTVSGNRLSISDTLSMGEYGKAVCTMRFTRQGDRLTALGEGDCHYWSGASCGLSGSMTRRNAAPSRRAASTAATTQPFIVGAWVSRGFACGGDGVIYEVDGTYATDGQAGRWQLSGNTLIETALETVELGEGETPIQNPRPVRSQILSVAPNRNAFTMRTADGEVWHMVRCR